MQLCAQSSTHEADKLVPAGEYRPDGQPRQLVEPTSERALGALKWSTGHSAHAVLALVSSSYRPALHASHEVSTVYVPAAHAPQVLDAMAPRGESRPRGHVPKHSMAPVALPKRPTGHCSHTVLVLLS